MRKYRQRGLKDSAKALLAVNSQIDKRKQTENSLIKCITRLLVSVIVLDCIHSMKK